MKDELTASGCCRSSIYIGHCHRRRRETSSSTFVGCPRESEVTASPGGTTTPQSSIDFNLVAEQPTRTCSHGEERLVYRRIT